jgi:hypothetical protein
MAGVVLTVLGATLLMVGVTLFFAGFVLAPIVVLAIGLAVFVFTDGDRKA